jgi:hypothetical protein
MGTYKGIQGFRVESLASDPTASEVLGKLWYNSASNVWKCSLDTSGSWATGGLLNLARSEASSAGASMETSLVASGYAPTNGGTYGLTAVVETYNGTSWTEKGDVNTARREGAGDGIETAAFIAGGEIPANTDKNELYNGTGWTEVTGLPTARSDTTAAGTTTSGLISGGTPTPVGVDSWNGTAWTEETDLNTPGESAQGDGASNTSAWFMGGAPSTRDKYMEEWNGTSWTEKGDTTTARFNGSGVGTTTAGLVFAGVSTNPTAFNANVEEWNGTGWTEMANRITQATDTAGDGSTTSAITIGGWMPPGNPNHTSSLNASEEWTAGAVNVNTVTTS